MDALGADEAVNFDGGGSTSVTVGELAIGDTMVLLSLRSGRPAGASRTTPAFRMASEPGATKTCKLTSRSADKLTS